MPSTSQQFSTRHPTTKRILIARDRLTLLMFPIAKLRREEDTRRTIGLGVAFMQNWVIALVFSIAWLRTTRWFCATRNWRENHFGTTTTSQLVKGHAWTLGTVANVTLFIAFVATTIQYFIALQITDVI